MRAAVAFSVVFVVATAVAHVFPPVDLDTTCAAALCPVNTRCVEKPDKNGVIQVSCVPNKVKPGQCPKIDAFHVGICSSTCSTDSECEGSLKCCPNGCGATTCRTPRGLIPEPSRPSCATVKCSSGKKCVLQEVQCIRAPCYPVPVCVDDNGVRPGTCPAPSGFAGICVFDPERNCLKDADCAAGLKCCSEGCGKVCKFPAGDLLPLEKPGQCPKPNPLDVGICASTCKTDGNCPRSQKCCRNGCGATTCQEPRDQFPVHPLPTCDTVKCKPGERCVVREIRCVRAPCPVPRPECVPILGKTGQCPKPRFTFQALYCLRRDRCSNDGECPGALKCCPAPCGARCQEPVLTPTLTCATVDCLPGYTCVMQKRFPRPTCVKEQRCPFYPAWINPRCVPRDTCSEKLVNSCSPGTICCPTDCGRRCVRPME